MNGEASKQPVEPTHRNVRFMRVRCTVVGGKDEDENEDGKL